MVKWRWECARRRSTMGRWICRLLRWDKWNKENIRNPYTKIIETTFYIQIIKYLKAFIKMGYMKIWNPIDFRLRLSPDWTRPTVWFSWTSTLCAATASTASAPESNRSVRWGASLCTVVRSTARRSRRTTNISAICATRLSRSRWFFISFKPNTWRINRDRKLRRLSKLAFTKDHYQNRWTTHKWFFTRKSYQKLHARGTCISRNRVHLPGRFWWHFSIKNDFDFIFFFTNVSYVEFDYL